MAVGVALATGLVAAPAPAVANGGPLSYRFAGSGDYGLPTTPGVAWLSDLQIPTGLATDSLGNVYVSDPGNAQVYKITPRGWMTVFAGTGAPGMPLEGSATASPLRYPYSLAVDSHDNVFIGDTISHLVLKVDQDDGLSIVAGNGLSGTSGTGPATEVPVETPVGLAVDGDDNLFISNSSEHRVLKVAAGILTPFVGTGAAGVPIPAGPGTLSGLNGPSGLSVDTDGNLYIADQGNNVVEKVTPSGVVGIFAGNGQCDTLSEGPAATRTLCGPNAVAVDPATGTAVVSLPSQYRLVSVTQGGDLHFSAGLGTTGSSPTFGEVPLDTQIGSPSAVALSPDGSAYSLNSTYRVVTRFGAGLGPDKPTAVAATGADASATVTWVAPVLDGWSAITGYRVTLTPAAGTPVVTDTPDPADREIDVSGLVNGIAYTVTVAAINKAGVGLWSTDTVSVTPSTVPAAVSFNATPDDRAVDLTWTAPDNHGSAITGYTLKATPVVGGGQAVTAAAAAGDLIGSITGLSNGVAYDVTIRAANANGDGPWAAAAQVTPRTEPTAPQDLAAWPGNGFVALSFLPPQDDGGAPVLGYLVSRDDGVTWSPLSTGGTVPIVGTVHGLPNGEPAGFLVRAYNVAGNGAVAGPVTATPRTFPGDPTNVAVSPGNKQAMVSWTPPEDDGGAPITGYTIMASPADDGPPILAGAGPEAMMATVTGLRNGTQYTITVSAMNVAGTGGWSEAAPVTPANLPAVGSASLITRIHVGAPWVTLPVSLTLSKPRSWVNVTLGHGAHHIAWTTLTAEQDETTMTGSVRLGASHVMHGGDYQWEVTPQGPSTQTVVNASVRRHSMLGLSAVRTGELVTFRGSLRVYVIPSENYQPWAGHPVLLQRWTKSGWETQRALTTDARGNLSTQLRVPFTAGWRLVAADVAEIWGAESKSLNP